MRYSDYRRMTCQHYRTNERQRESLTKLASAACESCCSAAERMEASVRGSADDLGGIYEGVKWE